MIPPNRFGTVNPGVYRGSYPTLRNYRFLSRLQIKTIVSLIPETPNADLTSFAQMAGATIVHVPVSRLTTLNETLASTLISAINVQ
jgi:tyrosine-protein phosphatase OCA6